MESNRQLRKLAAVGAVLVLALACARLAEAQSIPAGTVIPVRVGTSLSSETSTAGETWDGSVARDVVVNGNTGVKAGRPVKGKGTYGKNKGGLNVPGAI